MPAKHGQDTYSELTTRLKVSEQSQDVRAARV